MDESNILFKLIENGEIDKFVEEHLQPVDNMVINARARELMRDGESSSNAYELANREYLEKRLDALYQNTQQERTSTAVTTVPSDTYNANFPDSMQNTNSMQMTILPNGKMISRVMNPANAGQLVDKVRLEIS